MAYELVQVAMTKFNVGVQLDIDFQNKGENPYYPKQQQWIAPVNPSHNRFDLVKKQSRNFIVQREYYKIKLTPIGETVTGFFVSGADYLKEIGSDQFFKSSFPALVAEAETLLSEKEGSAVGEARQELSFVGIFDFWYNHGNEEVDSDTGITFVKRVSSAELIKHWQNAIAAGSK